MEDAWPTAMPAAIPVGGRLLVLGARTGVLAKDKKSTGAKLRSGHLWSSHSTLDDKEPFLLDNRST